MSLRSPFRGLDDPANWAASPLRGGTPGQPNGFESEFVSTTLITDGAPWRYRRGSSAFPAGWTGRTYDDGAWDEGAAGFGYGDGDDQTLLNDMQGAYLSLAIRHTFTVADPGAFDRLVLQAWYDDGFVAYLNGVEVARSSNVGGSPPAYDTAANPDHEAAGFEDFDISAHRGQLRAGTNVLALQGHNAGLSSSDFSLRPALLGQETVGGADSLGIVFNECYWFGPAEHFVELYNRGTTTVDLSGFFLSNTNQDLQPAQGALPVGSVLAAGAFLVVSEGSLPFTFGPVGTEDAFTLYLTAPNGIRVSAARTFDTDVAWDRATGRWPDGADAWYEMAASRNAANVVDVETDVVINEIMYHPFHEDNPYDNADNGLWDENIEYLELYNRGSRTIDLSDYRFTQGIRYTFPRGVLLDPHAYLVLAKNPTRLIEVYGLSSDIVLGPYEGVLSDQGELVRLKDANGNTVDEVQYYEGGRWSRWADGGGSSLELIDPFQDNNVASAWAGSDETAKADWHHVSYQGPPAGSENELQLYLTSAGEVLLDDIRLAPTAGGGTNYINNGGFESGTSGWVIEGTHAASQAVTWDHYSGSRSLLIRAESRGDTRSNRIETNLNHAYPPVCSIDYWAKWQRGSNRLLTRTHWHGAPFCASLPVPLRLGTPGAQNSTALVNQGPVLARLDQEPKVPAGGQAVGVTCYGQDADGISRMDLRWRLEGQTAWTVVSMHDDGASRDGKAGDGVWGGTVPAQASNAVVEFYVEAEDAAANIGVFPPDSPADGATAMYRVGDALVSTKLLTYRVNLRARDHDWLYNRPRLSNELMPGTFVFGDERIHYNIGFRFRGSPWIRPGTPGSGYRIKFNTEESLFDREEEINLDRNQQDGTEVKERTSYYFDRKMGSATDGVKVPFSEQHFVRFRYNGQDANNSLYLHVQKIDRNYLDFWWRDDGDGSLWKIDDYFEIDNDSNPNARWRCTFQYRGTDKESYRYIFKLRTRQKVDDYSELIDLIDFLANGSAAEIDEMLEDRLDIREWSAIFAVRFFIGDWDTIGYTYGKNAFVYLPPDEGRWKMIHWDSDLTFGSGDISGPLTPTNNFPVLRDLFARLWVRKIIMSDYAYLLKRPVNRAFIDPILDRWASTMAGEPGAGGVGEIKNFISSRTNYILSQLPSGSFEITTRGGVNFSTDDAQVTLAGTAPLEADIFTVGGQDVSPRVRWLSTNTWEVDLDLAPGPNVLACAVYQRDGTFAGSDSITVTSNQTPPPSIEGLSPAQGPPAGGTDVAILGGNFVSGAEVFFGRTASPAVTFVSAGELRAISPAGTGAVPVFVRNPDGGLGVFTSFVYGETTVDVMVSSVTPDRGPRSGGTQVVVSGRGFAAGARVFFGGREASSVTRTGDTEIRATAPAAWPLVTVVGVTVRNLDGSEGYRPQAFTYTDGDPGQMAISAITPSEGSVLGGTEVTITGTGFPSRPEDTAVLFALQPAEVVAAGPTAVRAIVPAGRLGRVDVSVVDTARGLRVTASEGFEYTPGAGSFLRGDANGDDTVNVADALRILEALFSAVALDCQDGADANDDGSLNVADPIFLLDYLFGRGQEPPLPYPAPGGDGTADSLGCSRS